MAQSIMSLLPTSMNPLLLGSRRDLIWGAVIGGGIGDAIGLNTEFFSHPQCLSIYDKQQPRSLRGNGRPRFSLFEAESKERDKEEQGLRKRLALGETVGTKIIVERYKDGHRNLFSVGSWTDDTDQSILILFSYRESRQPTPSSPKEINPRIFAKHLKEWCRNGIEELGTGADDIGITVGTVVSSPEFLEYPHKVATQVWESGGKKAAANGAVMRTAIIAPLFFNPTQNMGDGKAREVVSKVAIEMALVTHADPRCLLSSVVVTSLLLSILRRDPPFSLLSFCVPTDSSSSNSNLPLFHPQSPLTSQEIDSILEKHLREGKIFVANYLRKEVREIWDDEEGERELRRFCQGVWDEVDIGKDLKQKGGNSKNGVGWEKAWKDGLERLKLDSGGIGYTYKTLGASLLALRTLLLCLSTLSVYNNLPDQPFETTNNLLPRGWNIFELLITDLVMRGGDADTNAQPAASLLGGVLGWSGLEDRWKKGLNHHDWLVGKLEEAITV